MYNAQVPDTAFEAEDRVDEAETVVEEVVEDTGIYGPRVWEATERRADPSSSSSSSSSLYSTASTAAHAAIKSLTGAVHATTSLASATSGPRADSNQAAATTWHLFQRH